jgi:hypothetical protein
MVQQLEKITDLVRLIVQKMEIPAEMEIDDTSKDDMRIQKLPHEFNTTRRFALILTSRLHHT